MDFLLHKDLERDGIEIGNFPLCKVLLIDDCSYPWFVLVPRKPNVTELHELDEASYQSLCRESRLFCLGLKSVFGGDKLNVASLGNITSQLHIHHVVRYRNDRAWPAPIWGQFEREPYPPEQIETLKSKLKNANIDDLVLC